MISTLAIAGYRSLRNVRIGLGQLTVVTGPNGSGKSSLYRALHLLAEIAQGRLVEGFGAEGGLNSAMWAGELPLPMGSRNKPAALKLGFGGEDYGYAIDLGPATVPGVDYLPENAFEPAREYPTNPFAYDPHVKAEAVWLGPTLHPRMLLAQRRGTGCRVRDGEGLWVDLPPAVLSPFGSMMTALGDPRDMLELLVLRERMRNWRFYDRMRTDEDAPARRDSPLIYTPVLPSDGSRLAAALETICHNGDEAALHAHIDDAFPGAVLPRGGTLAMYQPGLRRPLSAAELSDGTLRYLMLVAALLSPRPPALMVLNEPENSLHPALIPPLARLIQRAAREVQTVVVTHSQALAGALEGAVEVALHKENGQTQVTQPEVDALPWTWPERG